MSTFHYETFRFRRCKRRSDEPAEPARRKTEKQSVGGLSWRRFAVGKNFRNGRRKLINSRAGNNDAVAAAVSFLGDTQEPAALIFPELDVEVLALNLQFSGFDDVIHFALRAPSLGNRGPKWKQNRRVLGEFIIGSPLGKKQVPNPCWACSLGSEGCCAARST